jgi:hypothetical protein
VDASFAVHPEPAEVVDDFIGSLAWQLRGDQITRWLEDGAGYNGECGDGGPPS